MPGWAQKIYSPFDGKVVEVVNNIQDHKGLNIFKDLGRVLMNEITMRSNLNNYKKYVGNYIVIEGESCYAALAHERCGSIEVKEGQTVKAGQYLAEVGHSGNSTAPHLHFQLMDHHDITRAKGVACSFKAYEVFNNGDWEGISNGVPKRWERIRLISGQQKEA